MFKNPFRPNPRSRDVYRDEVIAEIRDLIRAGWSQRAIARETGASRSFVQRVEQGKRVPYGEVPAPRSTLRRRYPPDDGEYRRCPQCGGKVQPPCLACEIRGDAGNRG